MGEASSLAACGVRSHGGVQYTALAGPCHPARATGRGRRRRVRAIALRAGVAMMQRTSDA